MQLTSIITMIIILLTVWGGLFYFIGKAYLREKSE